MNCRTTKKWAARKTRFRISTIKLPTICSMFIWNSEQEDINRIRKTALLHFAEDVAPYAFDDYLSEGKRGKRTILRLPADGDPMLARVQKIREREYMFVDLLDENYKAFHSQHDRTLFRLAPLLLRRSYSRIVNCKRASLATKLIGAATVVGGIAVSNNSQARHGRQHRGASSRFWRDIGRDGGLRPGR